MADFPWSSIIETAGGLISSAFGVSSEAKANKQRLAESQRDREFQERMVRNKHQYEVEDLRKAGLNPILSANAGAGAPSGSMATLNSTAKDVAQNMQLAKLGSEISLAKEMKKTEKTKQAQNLAGANLQNSAKDATDWENTYQRTSYPLFSKRMQYLISDNGINWWRKGYKMGQIGQLISGGASIGLKYPRAVKK